MGMFDDLVPDAGSSATKPPPAKPGLFDDLMPASSGGATAGAPSAGLFDDLVPEPGFWRKAADVGLEFVSGAAGGEKMLADAFGAGSEFSRGVDMLQEEIGKRQSPARQAEKAAQAQRMREAEQSGDVWNEVGAAVRNFAEAPVSATANALGSSLPSIAGAAATALSGGATLPLVAGATIGATQGAGSVKGEIHDAVKSRLMEGGMSEAEASARAGEAQGYVGQNADQIALGAGLGALSGSTGVERIASNLIRGTTARGLAARVASGAATEALPEAAQGGQERLGANVASQREGFEVPTWQGVAGQATSEGLAGAATGGVFGLPRPAGPLSRAAEQATRDGAGPVDQFQDVPAGGEAAGIGDPLSEPILQASRRPFPMTEAGALRRAAELMERTGQPHEIRPHPTAAERFYAAPVAVQEDVGKPMTNAETGLVEAVEIGTPASERGESASSGEARNPHPPAGVTDKLAQTVASVKRGMDDAGGNGGVLFSFAGREAQQDGPLTADDLMREVIRLRQQRAITPDTLRKSVAARFPRLAGAVETMIQRGGQGARGGVVVIPSANEEAIARAYSQKTGHDYHEALQQLLSRDGRLQGFYDTKSGLTFLIGPELDAESAPAVLLHEMIHSQQRADIDARAMRLVERRAKIPMRPEVRELMGRVAERMEAAGETGNAQEATAYIVEEAVSKGRQAGFSAIDGKFLEWVDRTFSKRVGDLVRDFVAMVRAWGLKRRVPLKNLSIDDLVAFAKAGAKSAARGRVVSDRGEARPSFAGERAATADRHTRAAAQQRLEAGEDAETVRQETGWFQGPDKKWRFEINDRDAALRQGEASTTNPSAYMDWIEESQDRPNGVPLGQVLDHPALFAAYPALRQMRVKVADLPKGTRGQYDSFANMLTIPDPYRTGDDVLSVMLHEIQHGIQTIERFATGGNSAALAESMPSSEALNDAKVLRARMDRGESLGQARAWFLNTIGRDAVAEASYLAERHGSRELHATPSTPHEAYRRLAGEVEARNVQRRQDMTDLERSYFPPSMTADVKDSEVIVTFNGREMANAPAPENAMGSDSNAGRLGVREWVTHQLRNHRGWAMGALTRDQITDIYGRDMPQVAEFDRVVQEMDAQRNRIAEAADALVERWRQLPAAAADRLADTMHRATITQFDPDKHRGGLLIGEPKEIQALWESLPAEAQQLYRDVRDQYSRTLTAIRDGLADRAEQAGTGGARVAAEIRIEFDKYLKEGPYFPLARFGDLLLIANRGDERKVEAFESSAQRERRARQMRLGGWTVKLTSKAQYSATQDGAAGQFVGEVLSRIHALDMPADQKSKLMDGLNQLAISTLPDASYRKHFAHRKGTPGFSSDAMRAFAASMQHAAHHITKIRHAHELAFLLDEAQKEIREARGDIDVTERQQVINELSRRLDYLMSPNTHPVAAAAGQVGFVMSLGGSVASGLVNLSQTPMVTLPWLGARHGFGKAGAALMKASRDYFGGKFEKWSGFVAAENPNLADDEKAALRKLEEAGLINLTQAHDLAGTANTDSTVSKRAWAANRAMKIVGWTFHVPEVFNRQVTALAAYRLARESGKDDAAALEHARQALIRTHFDYSASNRARAMQGNFMRVITMFKQYSQQMTYLLWRNAYLALKGESPEVKREARRMLLGIAATHFSAAGTLGLPLGVFGISPLLALLAMGMGDEDDPWDWETEYRNLLADTFGQGLGEAIARGPARLLLNVDLASRVGLGDLWIRPPAKEAEGRDLVEAWMVNLLGPTAGYIGNLGTAAQAFNEGKFGRGVEAMMPKFISAPLKAYRYETEGVRSWRGDDLGVALSTADVLGTALGFQPARLAEMYEGRAAIKSREARLQARREEIINMWVAASLAGDRSGVAEAFGASIRFNRANPAMRITSDTFRRSLATKRRNALQIQSGTYLARSRESLRETGRFANVQ